jgi:hypothetical protein
METKLGGELVNVSECKTRAFFIGLIFYQNSGNMESLPNNLKSTEIHQQASEKFSRGIALKPPGTRREDGERRGRGKGREHRRGGEAM